MTTECLPPDPSVPGLWWVRDESQGIWDVVRWYPEKRGWVLSGVLFSPAEAHRWHWRCVAPAVPPSAEPDWSDAPLPEDAAIAAAHPMATGRHDLYAEAMRLVGARRSKGGLVGLVNWLLARGAGTGQDPAPEALAHVTDARTQVASVSGQTVLDDEVLNAAMECLDDAAAVLRRMVTPGEAL